MNLGSVLIIIIAEGSKNKNRCPHNTLKVVQSDGNEQFNRSICYICGSYLSENELLENTLEIDVSDFYDLSPGWDLKKRELFH